ncbi:MAG: DNA-processing protein DprA [Candidatus Nanopelagicales bacterium]
MSTLIPGCRSWPRQLDDLEHETPQRLWVTGTGDLRLLALRSVAIVGARTATSYGVTVAGTLAASLAEAGWVTISGAAFGIDSAAHRGALAAGGATIAVMAGGVDVPVPISHAGLLERIADTGALVSDRSPGSQPMKGSFLARNRLIAALSRATIVVEAGHRSGALNTVQWAELLGRPVLAVPGPCTSAMSRGTHSLIRTGRAELVRDVADVLEALRADGPPQRE